MNPYTEDADLPMPIATALLENQTPVLPEPARTARMRAQLLQTVRAEKLAVCQSAAAGAQSAAGAQPAPGGHVDARGLYTLRAPEGEWIKIGPALEMKVLRSDTESRSFLLRMHPGARVPPHQHSDVEEECYVLEGEAYIGDLRLHSGDYHLAPRGAAHDWLCSDTGALLLLRAELEPQYFATGAR